MSGQTWDDDDWLAALADAARAQPEARDVRWEALAAGALSPDGAAALRALAAAHPAAGDAWAAFAPRDPALDDAIAAAICAQTRPGAPVVAISTAPSARRRWAVAAAVAMAASLLAFALRPGPAAPDYALDSRAGEQAMRGDAPSAQTVYGPGSQVDLVLRPAVDVRAPIAVRVFHARGGAIAPLPARPTQAASGVFRLRGGVDAVLPPGPGAQQLIFAVGAPDAVPKSVDALRAGLLNGPHRWQILRHEYRRR